MHIAILPEIGRTQPVQAGFFTALPAAATAGPAACSARNVQICSVAPISNSTKMAPTLFRIRA